MNLGLAGRVALVCGSTKGLGRAVAKALAQEGARVAVNGRHDDSVERVAEQLCSETGQSVSAFVADVGVPAQAEGLVGAARAFMWQTTAEVWDVLCAGRPVTMRQRAMLRLANTIAVQNAAQAVDLMWAAAGSSPVYTTSPLERCFRDIHVATQHAAVGVFSLETIGAALIDPNPTRAAAIALI